MLTDHGLHTSPLRGSKFKKNRGEELRQKDQNFWKVLHFLEGSLGGKGLVFGAPGRVS